MEGILNENQVQGRFAEGNLLLPSFIRNTQEVYLTNKEEYDKDGTIFWCIDKPIIYVFGTPFYGVSQELIEANIDGVKAVTFDPETNEVVISYFKEETTEKRIKLVVATAQLDGLMSRGDKINLDTLIKAIITDNMKGTLEAKIKEVDDKFDNYLPTTEVESKIANVKSEILGGAGEDYNTLKEIETWIGEHGDLYQALVTTVGEKAALSYVNEQLGLKADADKVYTKEEADEKFLTDHQSLAEYAKKTEVTAEIEEAVAPLATKQEVTSGLEAKADKSDTYTKNEVDTELGKKANSADVYSKSETYTKGEIDSAIEGAIDELGFEEALATKANAADVYKKTETYTKEEVDTAIKVTDDKLAGYDKSEVVDSKIEAATDDMATKTYVGSQVEQAKTDLEGQINQTKSELEGKIEEATDDMATQSWVESKKYLQEHQSIDGDNAIKVEGEEAKIIKLLLASANKFLSQSPDGLLASLSFKDDEENHKIQLIGIGNTVVSEFDYAKFIVDGMLEDADLNESDELVLTMNTSAGSKELKVNLAKYIDVYTQGNGITIQDKTISAKVKEGDEFLEVTEEGIASKGINEAIGSAVQAVSTELEALKDEVVKEVSINGVDATVEENKATVEIDGSEVKLNKEGTGEALTEGVDILDTDTVSDAFKKVSTKMGGLLDEVNAEIKKGLATGYYTIDFLEGTTTQEYNPGPAFTIVEVTMANASDASLIVNETPAEEVVGAVVPKGALLSWEISKTKNELPAAIGIKYRYND